jgi:oxygen-independent coproporphyrinogen III oxidase
MNAGIYLHIPFCKSRCSYCDFATDVFKNNDTVERYVSAICKEIEVFPALSTLDSGLSTKNIETIYFGGGTPSLLSPKQLEKILNAIHKQFTVAEKIELTVEMNPATVSLETLVEYRKLGVNRASFGVQTFDDTELKRLARGHDANDVRETLRLLREADFDNISFDLIAGLPRQTVADWERNLDEALKLMPEHLSLYLLEITESTPLAEQIRTNRQPMPDEELSSEMYEMMLRKTAEKGYEQYEISNFCQPNFEAKHNSKYWLCEPVYAFGVSAHSFDGKTRTANERDTNKYVSMIENDESTVVFRDEIDLASDVAFLGLRSTGGLDLDAYKLRFGIDLQAKFTDDLQRLRELELIEFAGNKLKLTVKGMVYSNEVFSVFV